MEETYPQRGSPERVDSASFSPGGQWLAESDARWSSTKCGWHPRNSQSGGSPWRRARNRGHASLPALRRKPVQ